MCKHVHVYFIYMYIYIYIYMPYSYIAMLLCAACEPANLGFAKVSPAFHKQAAAELPSTLAAGQGRALLSWGEF